MSSRSGAPSEDEAPGCDGPCRGAPILGRRISTIFEADDITLDDSRTCPVSPDAAHPFSPQQRSTNLSARRAQRIATTPSRSSRCSSKLDDRELPGTLELRHNELQLDPASTSGAPCGTPHPRLESRPRVRRLPPEVRLVRRRSTEPLVGPMLCVPRDESRDMLLHVGHRIWH